MQVRKEFTREIATVSATAISTKGRFTDARLPNADELKNAIEAKDSAFRTLAEYLLVTRVNIDDTLDRLIAKRNLAHSDLAKEIEANKAAIAAMKQSVVELNVIYPAVESVYQTEISADGQEGPFHAVLVDHLAKMVHFRGMNYSLNKGAAFRLNAMRQIERDSAIKSHLRQVGFGTERYKPSHMSEKIIDAVQARLSGFRKIRATIDEAVEERDMTALRTQVLEDAIGFTREVMAALCERSASARYYYELRQSVWRQKTMKERSLRNLEGHQKRAVETCTLYKECTDPLAKFIVRQLRERFSSEGLQTLRHQCDASRNVRGRHLVDLALVELENVERLHQQGNLMKSGGAKDTTTNLLH